MKTKLKAVGMWLVKWVISPLMIVIAIFPMLLGVITSGLWTAFKAGWNLPK